MNASKKLLWLAASALVFFSCDHTVSMETTVHPDGSLDKIIVMESGDSTGVNFLGISANSGWEMEVEKNNADSKSKVEDKTDWIISFSKSFASAEEANLELATPSDTLFRVTSRFDKKFRWFYTYLYYSDTYCSLNRMKFPPNDYLTQEDYAFIDRLPSEGSPISKADSLYLTNLNTKIFDVYGKRALEEGYYDLLASLVRQNQLGNQWIDTLNRHKPIIFAALEKQKDIEDDYLLKLADSLQIPLPEKKVEQYHVLASELESRTNFISNASDGKYSHKINMPWPVVGTNADSVAGQELFWRPPSLRFLLKDYTLYGQSRKLNYWAIIVSVVFVLFTGGVLVRRRK